MTSTLIYMATKCRRSEYSHQYVGIKILKNWTLCTSQPLSLCRSATCDW
jgi:hypothetical protein